MKHIKWTYIRGAKVHCTEGYEGFHIRQTKGFWYYLDFQEVSRSKGDNVWCGPFSTLELAKEAVQALHDDRTSIMIWTIYDKKHEEYCIFRTRWTRLLSKAKKHTDYVEAKNEVLLLPDSEVMERDIVLRGYKLSPSGDDVTEVSIQKYYSDRQKELLKA
ncbi:hypothetical protein LCGC14_0146280 [marine sediment metagenome]|uniref:Uncharacterized protein n=1 Tax=marine sediment metagenome TaxID=412755 RepID=A0A0F9VFE7_9ZZZZ